MKKLACILGAASMLALGSAAFAYAEMDPDLRAQLIELGLDEEAVAAIDADQAAEVQEILASEAEEDAMRDQILALIAAEEADETDG